MRRRKSHGVSKKLCKAAIGSDPINDVVYMQVMERNTRVASSDLLERMLSMSSDAE